MPDVVCPNCGEAVEFHRKDCLNCGFFVGYPNVRRAESMRVELATNYADALANAIARGVTSQVAQLEGLLGNSGATINVSANILSNMAIGHSYISYYKALDDKLRRIAEAKYHAHRAAVDAKLHPGYESEILNAALSPDGRGLTNYGEITMRLRDVSIRNRASVLRENAFDFYEAYDLGRRDAEEAPGWRSVWADRARLGVAYLAATVTPSLASHDLHRAILASGPDRRNDRFMEVHIFGELTRQAIENVSLDKPLTDATANENWDFAGQKLARIGVTVMDRTRP
ncbi:MAG: hypothetical protein ACHQF3_01815 [Alphaproteobacteria bacterium]